MNLDYLKKNKWIFLIIFGIIIFSIRLIGLTISLYDDEANFAYTLSHLNSFGFNTHYFTHIFFNWIYIPIIALFGLEIWVFRLVPWVFGILNTLLVYFFAKRHYSEGAAFFASLLMLISFYPTLASLQFDVEGSLVTFAITLLFFSLLESEKATTSKSKLFWQIMAGIGLGIPIIKYNPGYLIFTLVIYALINRHFNFRHVFKDLFVIYLTGAFVFFSFILLGIISSPDNWLNFVWVGGFSDTKFGHPIYYLALSMFLLWSTPLLFSFYPISILKWDRKNLLLIIWISVPLLVYSFLLPYGAMDRYFMNTIPALCMLGGYFIAKMNFNKKQVIIGSVLFTFFTTLFFILNLIPFKYIPRFPELYLSELKNLNLNFLFAYTSASGPTFGMNFLILFLVLVISFMALLGFWLWERYIPENSNNKNGNNNNNKKNKNITAAFFLIFISVGLAYNVFLVSEYLFHPTTPNVSEVQLSMINYVKENNLSYPIYTNDEGVQWTLDHDYKDQIKTQGFADNEIGLSVSKATERIKQSGGTILLLHWPPLPDNSPAWEVVRACKIDRQFYSKGILIGDVYHCNKNN
ncbi:glycosyltransferase family 39 protein [Candidatus Woesearchaeota archaeon]|nr:glycosyltransferase family 39 protein [Candidatus Woesearchaeota archaeon]